MKMEEQQTASKPRDIYEAFVLELQQWSRNGKPPRQADQDLAWVLENQHTRLRSRNLLRKKLVDIAATDAHGLGRRSPILSRGYRDVARKYGEAYADAIFADNPRRLLEGESREGAITNHE